MSMSSNAIRLAWQRICKFYELEDCHFHDLRHMAIHHFANVKNISVADCMIISGHKEPRTLLRIYAQSRPKEVANKLNKIMDAGLTAGFLPFYTYLLRIREYNTLTLSLGR